MRRQRASLLVFYMLVFFELMFAAALAQNLGSQPAVNKAVQGQTASQPEGAFLNLVNWVGNVIAPVGAALCLAMAIASFTPGRGVALRPAIIQDL